MVKKASNQQSSNRSKKATTSKTNQSEQLLEQIADALKNPALNGGFDTLLHKIDSIERSQGHTSTKVDELCRSHECINEKITKIHSAIYDPDDGLFARQHASAASSDAVFAELTTWQKHIDKAREKDEEVDEKIAEKLDNVSDVVDDIVKARSTIRSITKWTLTSVGGAGFALLVKFLYDVISASGG